MSQVPGNFTPSDAAGAAPNRVAPPPPSPPPSDPGEPRPSGPPSLGRIFSLAAQRYNRNYGRASWVYTVACLIGALPLLLPCCLFITPVISAVMEQASQISATGQAPANVMADVTNLTQPSARTYLLWLLANGLMGLLLIPLQSAFLWSAVCSFDNRRMVVSDLFYGLRTRYRVLATLGLAQGGLLFLSYLMATGGVQLLGLDLAALATGRASAASLSSLIIITVLQQVLMVAPQALVLLAPTFAFVTERPTAAECLRQNWRLLRTRTADFVAVLAVLLVALLALSVISLFAGGQTGTSSGRAGPEITAMTCLAPCIMLLMVPIVGWLIIYYEFLRAALFRVVQGYSLDPPPQMMMVPYQPPAARP